MVSIATERQRPVSFDSQGQSLFGMLHLPKGGDTKLGVIFVNSGLQYRVGPHHLYVKVARALAESGITSLRMDMSGLGDSEGEITEAHFDLLDPRETMDAVNFLLNQTAVEKVVLLGICSGARSVLKAAAKSRQVEGIILWSLPVISLPPNLPAPNKDHRGWISRTGARFFIRKWIKKGTSWKSWQAYFSSGGSWKALFTSFKNVVFYGLLGRQKKWATNRHAEFFAAMKSYLRSRRKALFVFGERDALIREEFEERYKDIAAGENPDCMYLVASKADHTFSSEPAQSFVIHKTVEWLKNLTEQGKRHVGSGS